MRSLPTFPATRWQQAIRDIHDSVVGLPFELDAVFADASRG